MSVKTIVDAYEAGRTKYTWWRKNPTQATAAGIWFDLSGSPGSPTPNYYIGSPYTATQLTRSDNGGLDHGNDVATTTATTGTLGGSISGTTFTDTTHRTGLFTVGMTLTGTGVLTDTRIIALGTGTGQNNGGTYIVDLPQTVTAQTITGTIDSGSVKYLHKFSAITATATAVPMTMILGDYLLFYPFLEQSTGSVDMVNVATVPRYTTGAGVQVMPILQNAQVGNLSDVFFTYTNSAGVAGRTSKTFRCNTQTVSGTVVNSSAATVNGSGPFVPLQEGDTGVRSIQSVTVNGDDIGLFALVLMKPLATLSIYDITAPTEVDLFIDRQIHPVIKDNAFLGTIVLPFGTIASSYCMGELHTYWTQ